METSITSSQLKLWILTLQKYLLIILKCIGMNANDFAAAVGTTPNTIRTFMANPVRAIMTKQTFISVMTYLDFCITDINKSDIQRKNLQLLMNAVFSPSNYKKYSYMVDLYMNKMRATTSRVLTRSTDTNKMINDDMVDIDLYTDSIPVKSILSGYYSSLSVNKELFTDMTKRKDSSDILEQVYSQMSSVIKPGMDSFDIEIAYLEKIKTEHPETKNEIDEAIARLKKEQKIANDILGNNVEELVMADWQVDLDNREKEIEKDLETNTTLLKNQEGIPLWQDYVFYSYNTALYNELKTAFTENHKGDSSYLDKQINQLLEEVIHQK